MQNGDALPNLLLNGNNKFISMTKKKEQPNMQKL